MVRADVLFTCLGFALAASAGNSREAPRRPAYDGSDQPGVARQIFVDGDCRILPNSTVPLPGRKSHPFRDSTICSIESAADSEHMEEQISGNQVLRYRVHIVEQTYVLQNISDDHIVFVIERTVPSGWSVDSDPQPNRYTGTSAVFPVHAQPGEIVRLHVGIRNSRPLKPRTISGAKPRPKQPGGAS